MKLSHEALKEFIELSRSQSMRRDMEAITSQRHNPFVKDGKADVDAYIEFATGFNEFINHQPKPFTPMRDEDMRL